MLKSDLPTCFVFDPPNCLMYNSYSDTGGISKRSNLNVHKIMPQFKDIIFLLHSRILQSKSNPHLATSSSISLESSTPRLRALEAVLESKARCLAEVKLMNVRCTDVFGRLQPPSSSSRRPRVGRCSSNCKHIS